MDFARPIVQFPHGVLFALCVLFLTVAIPTLLWFVFLSRHYPQKTASKKLMVRSFILGIFSALAGILWESKFFNTIGLPDITHFTLSTPFLVMILSAFLVGFTEEFLKYIALYVGVYRSKKFANPFDGIVFGCSVALGASLIENIFYFTNVSVEYSATIFITVMVGRGLFTATGHIISTSILGYYLGKAKFSNTSKFWLMLQGLIYAATLHGTLDFLLTALPSPFGWICAATLDIVSLIIFVKMLGRKEKQII